MTIFCGLVKDTFSEYITSNDRMIMNGEWVRILKEAVVA
jgi:hypothetical protein